VQEKLNKFEKELSENSSRINSIEKSVTPLFEKMDKLTEAMIKNTASHQETTKMQERIIKRQDKQDIDLRDIHDELAAARPAIKLMNGLSVKMTYFGFIMITIAVTVLIVIAKGGATV
jgi:chromosome segregation ATPase